MNLLITGSDNLSKYIMDIFYKNGFNIYYTYHDIDKCNNKNYNSIKCDLKNEEDINNLINNIPIIDILINNASISLDSKIENKTKDEFMSVLEVNLVGTFLLTRGLIINNKVKKVINISSTDSIDTYSEYNIDYSISKLGMNKLNEIFQKFYPNIKFITILLNWVDTLPVLNMNQEYLNSELKRIGQKELLKKEDVALDIYNISINKDSLDVIRIG